MNTLLIKCIFYKYLKLQFVFTLTKYQFFSFKLHHKNLNSRKKVFTT